MFGKILAWLRTGPTVYEVGRGTGLIRYLKAIAKVK